MIPDHICQSVNCKFYGCVQGVKATSPAAGPASSAGSPSSEGGTERVPAGLCRKHIKVPHPEETACEGWTQISGVRTAVHPESANDKQVGGEHYKLKIQTWDFITANGIGFLEGNAIKYIVRHKSKGGREDLEKAIHYLQKALEVYYPEET